MQALQQLDAGHRRAVGVVGVRAQRHGPVGQVAGIRAGIHLKKRTEVGGANKPETLRNGQYRVGLGGRAVDHDEPQLDEILQGPIQHLVVLQIGPLVNRLWRQVGPPWLRIRAAFG